VLIEDPALIVDDLATPTASIDVTACSGPRDERAVMPARHGRQLPARAVRRRRLDAHGAVGAIGARRLGPDVHPDGRRHRPHRDRSDRTVHHHIGAAIQHLWATTYRAIE